MKTAKVLNIFTKQEITEMPYSIENAADLMEYLMRYQNPRTTDPVSYNEFIIIDNLLRMLENNSGITREDISVRLNKGA